MVPHSTLRTRLLSLAILSLALSLQANAQYYPGWWLPIDTVTTGPFEDHNPSMPHTTANFYGNRDTWMVFDRLTPTESQIAAVKLLRNTSTFDTAVAVLYSRGLPDIQTKPDVGMISYYRADGIHNRHLAAWQCFKHGRWQILYATTDDSSKSWTNPRSLVSDTVDNTDVRVLSVSDTVFVITWIRRNQVLGICLDGETLSPPEVLAESLADSLQYDIAGRFNIYDLVWKSKLSGEDAILHRRISRGAGTTLSDPDTVALGGNLSNPHAGVDWEIFVLYESTVNGKSEVFGSRGSYYDHAHYFDRVNISSDSLADDRNPRSFSLPVVTKTAGRSSTAAWYSDVTVFEKYRGSDSMLVFLTGLSDYGQKDTVRSRGYNRNAVISTSMQWGGQYSRLPVAWESNRTGNSHIYGRMVARFSGDAPETNTVPRQCELYQNYPNPFNPSTRISWFMPQAGQVRLTVYDMLGREVVLLADERMDEGRKQVAFDGSGLASGVYFYRLRVRPAGVPAVTGASEGEFVRTRAMILIR